MDVGARLDRLRSALAGLDEPPDALLVTSTTNIRYLTGFTGSAGLLFVVPGDVVLVTDGRYGQQADEQLAAAGVAARVVVAKAPEQVQKAREIVVDSGAGQLALEAAHASWQQQRSIAHDWLPDVDGAADRRCGRRVAPGQGPG